MCTGGEFQDELVDSIVLEMINIILAKPSAFNEYETVHLLVKVGLILSVHGLSNNQLCEVEEENFREAVGSSKGKKLMMMTLKWTYKCRNSTQTFELPGLYRKTFRKFTLKEEITTERLPNFGDVHWHPVLHKVAAQGGMHKHVVDHIMTSYPVHKYCCTAATFIADAASALSEPPIRLVLILTTSLHF